MIVGVVVALTVATCKMVELCELDRRAYNLFAKKKVDISMDNFVVNALARHQKRQLIYEKFKNQLKGVPAEHNGELLDQKTRVKLHLAYTLSKAKRFNSRDSITEEKFTHHVMTLSWWKRRTVLNGAVSKYIEQQSLSHCDFGDQLSKKDRQRYVADTVRCDYGFF